jgi:hypothetical protein
MILTFRGEVIVSDRVRNDGLYVALKGFEQDEKADGPPYFGGDMVE